MEYGDTAPEIGAIGFVPIHCVDVAPRNRFGTDW